MLIGVFSISAGTLLLYAGVEFLVRGSSAIALRLRMSHFLLSILRRRFYPLFANFLRFLSAIWMPEEMSVIILCKMVIMKEK